MLNYVLGALQEEISHNQGAFKMLNFFSVPGSPSLKTPDASPLRQAAVCWSTQGSFLVSCDCLVSFPWSSVLCKPFEGKCLPPALNKECPYYGRLCRPLEQTSPSRGKFFLFQRALAHRTSWACINAMNIPTPFPWALLCNWGTVCKVVLHSLTLSIEVWLGFLCCIYSENPVVWPSSVFVPWPNLSKREKIKREGLWGLSIGIASCFFTPQRLTSKYWYCAGQVCYGKIKHEIGFYGKHKV